ncbi:hypothetical protein BKA66DRAFT_508217 [Pyrenochaeta sp. MPI-SDFR-AT-0127]|nr:hypothetical protein BKA66DRAFT_508217 [Pyrenochaeta sp. MPI-SDFR-AT-0127]
MDIRRWLDETVQPGISPNQLKQLDIQPFLRTDQPEPKPVLKARYRRKRSISDSSLLDPPAPRTQVQTKKRRPPTGRFTDNGTEGEVSSATHSESFASNTSSKRYARQPRRKTRPERYIPSSKAIKERGKHAHRTRQGESKNSRRKPKRKKGKKPNSGIVQSFHAKNVSGDRLTLKPREQPGIFNKGKASTVVKGRGLPDLVFSEMKFLQKHKVEPKPTLPVGASKKKRKHDHTYSTEREISAFFSSLHPISGEQGEKSLLTKTPQHDDNLLEANRHVRGRSSVVDAAISTVEIPNNTSHSEHGSSVLHHESTSYASWSESIRSRGISPAYPRAKLTVDVRHLDSQHARHGRTTTGEGHTSIKRPASLLLNIQGTSDPRDCSVLSSMAQSHYSSCRSQSDLQQTSPPRPVKLVDPAAKFQTAGIAGFPTPMPRFVPVCMKSRVKQAQVADNVSHQKTRTTSLAKAKDMSHGIQRIVNNEENHAIRVLQTSSDLGNVLLECNNIMPERHEELKAHLGHTVRTAPAHSGIEVEQQGNTDLYPAVRRTSTVDLKCTASRASTSPNFVGHSIYEQQAQRELCSLQPGTGGSIIHDLSAIERDLLDNNSDMECTNRTWGEFVKNSKVVGLGGKPVVLDVEEGCVPEIVTQQVEAEKMAVAPGFWRPNRLY